MTSLLKYFVFGQDKITLLLDAFIIFSMISLIIAHMIIKKKEKNYTLWRMLCALPFVLCMIHFVFYRFSDWYLTETYYGPIYFSAVAILIWQVFYKKNGGYRISLIVLVIYVFGQISYSIVYTATSFPAIGNYTRENYEECFSGIISEMKRNYCLNDWKKIDYGYLESTIMPKIKKAREENNDVDFCIALCEYCYYFYDGHVTLDWNTEKGKEIYNKAKEKLAGNDYGFSMITLDNNETVAIMVDENSSVYKEGIHNGTVITQWNGVDISKAKENTKCIYPRYSFPVKENEDILKSIFLAGKGGKENKITFINDKGDEEEITIKSLGSYVERLESTLNKFYHRTKYFNINEYKNDNFSAKMISDDVGYLKIISEEYDEILDIKSVITHEYPEIVDLVDKKIEEMKKQGMDKLVIDTRNNSGGYDEVGGAVASLFTDEDFFNYSFGENKSNSYKKTDEHYVKAKGKWKGIEITVLTNSMCMSAGDGLVNNLAKCKNVSVVGLTTSQGVNQNNGGIIYTSDGDFCIAYPFSLTLDENSKPLIDTRSDRKSQIVLDEKIPLTKEAVEIIFGDNERDYEIEYLLEYFSR